jgi:hypothetical protein
VTRRRGILALLAAGLALAASSPAVASADPGQLGPPPQPPAPLTEVPAEQQESPKPVPATAEAALSNSETTTTWAHPVTELPIYIQPRVTAREITRTRILTEDGFPEVYLLLAIRTDSTGHAWVRMRVPGRPNGRIGWVLRAALGDFHKTHWRVVIDLRRRSLVASFDGRRRFVAPVGVGKPATPTPTGHFWIRERFRITSRSNPYWPWALGTSAYSALTDWPGGGIVGIHGDFGEPSRIPGDPSHGCVRMRAPDIARLAPLITLGTPVEIVA